jgi:hypothetical protein
MAQVTAPLLDSTVSELLVWLSLRKALIWSVFIFGGTDSKRLRDAK